MLEIRDILRSVRQQTDAEIYLVGGTVRDILRNRKPKDLDFVVRNIKPEDLENCLRRYGKVRLVGASFGVYNFRTSDGGCAEIALPRKQGELPYTLVSDPFGTIEEDSNHRDFTINAMYVPLDKLRWDGRFERIDVLDVHDGLDHMKGRLLVCVGEAEERILEDPLRMLRALRLSAETGYRVQKELFQAIRNHNQLLPSEVAPERIRDELIKIIESGSPSRAFRSMHRTGLLERILPELEACVGCGQNPKYHSYEVFEHLVRCADAACSLTNRLDVRFAALFHDLGKAPTRKVREGGDGPNDVSFHNHELVSTQLAYEILRRYRFPNELVEQICGLVRLHQYKYDRSWSDKAVRRFIRSAELTGQDLENLDKHPQFLVRQADRMGNALKAHLPITQKQLDFQERIRTVFKQSLVRDVRDLKISGNDIKEVFNLGASPKIGAIIRYLIDLVDGDPTLNERETLIFRAGQYLKELSDEASNSN